MVSKSERAIASGLLSRSKSMTRGGSGNGYNRMSAEDTRDESFGEEQGKSIDANNAHTRSTGVRPVLKPLCSTVILLSPESRFPLIHNFSRV